MDALGYSHKEEKWVPGVFTEGTQAQSEDKVIELLENKGKDIVHFREKKTVIKNICHI